LGPPVSLISNLEHPISSKLRLYIQAVPLKYRSAEVNREDGWCQIRRGGIREEDGERRRCRKCRSGRRRKKGRPNLTPGRCAEQLDKRLACGARVEESVAAA